MAKTFKTLYKTASTGSLLSWTISVDGATISESWGKVGGKQQSTSDTIREGKNIGKANETTPEQQAEKEAQGKWEKKLKAHNYTEVQADAVAGKASSAVEGGVLPMLAHKFNERGEEIVFPAAIQPKLDGHRMVAPQGDHGTELWTRSRKLMLSCPHITTALNKLFKHKQMDPIVTDGEGYNHDYAEKFEELTHFLRQVKYIPGSEVIQYHIYDAVIEGKTFSERWSILEKLLGDQPEDSCLKLVETIIVNDEDEMMCAFEAFRAQGYEGAIVRNLAGLYVNKRSVDLQKIKEFDDEEYLIVDVVEGRGRLQGHGIFVCQTPKGVRFECKLKGDISALKQYWVDPALAIGRQLTVQYQGLTGKNKVPRFPVGLRMSAKL